MNLGDPYEESRQQQLEAIRSQIGEANFRAAVDKLGEEELFRAFEDSDDEEESNAPRVLGWLRRNRLHALMPLTLGLVAAVVGILQADAGAGPVWRQGLAALVAGGFAGLVFNFFCFQLHVLMASFRFQLQIAAAVVAVGSVITSLVFLLVPSLSARAGWVALGVAGIAVLILLISTFYTLFACSKCGSFDSSAVEHRSRRCKECGHVSERWF